MIKAEKKANYRAERKIRKEKNGSATRVLVRKRKQGTGLLRTVDTAAVSPPYLTSSTRWLPPFFFETRVGTAEPTTRTKGGRGKPKNQHSDVRIRALVTKSIFIKNLLVSVCIKFEDT